MYWRVLPIKVAKKITAWVAIQREGYDLHKAICVAVATISLAIVNESLAILIKEIF